MFKTKLLSLVLLVLIEIIVEGTTNQSADASELGGEAQTSAADSYVVFLKPHVQSANRHKRATPPKSRNRLKAYELKSMKLKERMAKNGTGSSSASGRAVSLSDTDFGELQNEYPPQDEEHSKESGEDMQKDEDNEEDETDAQLDRDIARVNNPNKLKVRTFVLEASDDDDNFSCGERRGTLIPISANSKYFADSSNRYTRDQAKEACTQQSLIMAELDGPADQSSLQLFVGSFKSVNPAEDRFYIGQNDIRREGVYVREDDRKQIKFQNYHTSQPDDLSMKEDCTTISKETKLGPVGSSDDDCSKRFHILCMFKVNSQCFNESKETTENQRLEKSRGLTLLVNASERAYFVSNFQTVWGDALDYCQSKQLNLFNMDEIVSSGFFRKLVRWEAEFFKTPIPTVQYWTSGKFRKSHMNAEVYWKSKSNPTDSEESKTTDFTFSGIFQWSKAKLGDAGSPYIYRRDLCLSFGFEGKPDATPYVRNSNCDIPCFFICYEEYHLDSEPLDRRKKEIESTNI